MNQTSDVGFATCARHYQAMPPTCKYLHSCADVLAICEYFRQAFRSQHITQRGLREKARRSISVRHVRDAHCCILYTVVDDRVHGDGHTVLGQDLNAQVLPWHQHSA